MKKPPLFIVAWLLLPLLAGCGAQESAPAEDAAAERTPKVLFVGWDGIRVDVLREVPTPVLDELIAFGTFSDEVQTARPTVSGPCWSSILIGAWPEKHGVHSNDFNGNNYDEYPDMFTRIESVRPELNTFVAADWLPLVAEDAGGPLISDAVDKKVVWDGYEHGWLEADRRSVDAVIHELETGDPDAIFVYIGAPDEISHQIGGIGPEYRASIEVADAHLAHILDAVIARPTYGQEDWLILVVTDHGRTDTGGHGGDSPEEATVFYVANGPSVVPGTPGEGAATVDLPVTALTHLGIEIDPAWGLDGRVVGLGR